MRKTSSARKASPAFLQRVGNNIKSLREARGYSQQDLSHDSGLTTNYIGEIERGRINISLATIDALAKGLGCDVREIVTRRFDKEDQ
jgi:transcriptional regulator with XRE-family HTH domain